MGGTLGAAGASIASAGTNVSQITGRNTSSFKGMIDNLEVSKLISNPIHTPTIDKSFNWTSILELNFATEKRAWIQ